MDEEYGGVGVAAVDVPEGVEAHPADDKGGPKDQGGRANSEEYGAGEDYGDEGYDDEYRQGGFPADFRCAPPLFRHHSHSVLLRRFLPSFSSFSS